MKSPSVTKSLQGKSFAERGATCHKARKSMPAYFYRQKAASRRGTQPRRAKHVVARCAAVYNHSKDGEGLQIATTGEQDRRERFSGLPQKICFAKILWEEERPAIMRVKVCLHTFTAKRLRRDEVHDQGERST